jgi:hypothetical protein
MGVRSTNLRNAFANCDWHLQNLPFATCAPSGSGVHLSIDLDQPVHALVGRSVMALALAEVDADYSVRVTSGSISSVESLLALVSSLKQDQELLHRGLRWAMSRVWRHVTCCLCAYT